MIVPVLWCTNHDEIEARAYADLGLFSAILEREVWSPPDAIEFEHYLIRSPDDVPETDCALVVLPARHHTSDDDMAWFHSILSRVPAGVVLLAGDEAWEFRWQDVPETESRRVWAMQPRPEHIEAGLQGFPGGWYPGTHQGVKRNPLSQNQELDWFFGGQVTHQRREQCAAVLRSLGKESNGILVETDGYLQGWPQDTYWRTLRRAKVVPCPSGPMTVDTARVFEALEAGCVPVVDMVTPRGEDYDYWQLLFGDGAGVLPGIWKWKHFPKILDELLEDWPFDANRCSAMWQQSKRRWSKQLDSDLRAVSGQPSTSTDPNDLITAIITTSPTPGDPSTENIGLTVESIRAHLPACEIVIVCDGVRPEQADQTADYEEYVRRLLWRCNFEWSNVVPVVMDEWGHQANALRAGLQLVDAPLLLFMEHDTPLDEHPIQWRDIAEFLTTNQGNVVRFHHEKVMLNDHLSVMLDDRPQLYNLNSDRPYLPLIRTAAFWARPHLARTDFYRDKVMPLFTPESRTMIEERLYSEIWCAYKDRGMQGWAEWNLWLYAPSEPHMQRSTHLDSRGVQPKWEMSW